MKKLILLIVNCVSICNTVFPQFKGVPVGMAFESKAVISTIGYSKAGGGVVLKGKAEALLPNKEPTLLNVSFQLSPNNFLNLKFKTSSCDAIVSKPVWMLRDAAILVNGEQAPFEYVRDINLNGTPSPTEDTIHYPPNEYWYIEVNKNLINTKSGEILLLADLLQTDHEFYSNFNYIAINNFNEARKSIADKSAEESLYKLEYSDPTTTELDSLRFFLISEAINSQRFSDKELELLIEELHTYDNWTYNDEFTVYTYHCDCSTRQMFLKDVPNFTYLIYGYENEAMTSFFRENPELIRNLNINVISQAEDFAQVAAYFRYLKDEYPTIWNQIYQELKKYPSVGKTPRIILK